MVNEGEMNLTRAVDEVLREGGNSLNDSVKKTKPTQYA